MTVFTSFVPVALGLGGNLEPRRERLQQAAADLRRLLAAARFSPVFDTEPLHVVDQPRFLNAACIGWTDLSPSRLLDRLKALEREAGRGAAGVRFGPRELDLDILFYAGQVVSEPGLEIPHPRLAQRAFALVPLARLAPRWPHPTAGRTVRDLTGELGGTSLAGLVETDIRL